jgi:uncharacterized protein (TIGR02646 family)
MIQLPHHFLPAATSKQLKDWQEEIDLIAVFSDKVDRGKHLFKQKNTQSNTTFREVRSTLTRMCSGAQRCAYCEDSAADEVEHIKPKDLYPEVVFVWENYVYACGPCNSPKGGKFAVFATATGEFTDVTRSRNAEVVLPEPGAPVLIDPRQEDPLAFLHLDLLGTFEILPAWGLNAQQKQRAEYTIELLNLNRDLLVTARSEAFYSYKARLYEYGVRKAQGEPIESLHHALQNMQHPTVWKEMQRQYQRIPGLKKLFDLAPEALTW